MHIMWKRRGHACRKRDTLSEIYVEFRKSAVLDDHVICRCAKNENRKLITLENDEQEIYAVVEFTINN